MTQGGIIWLISCSTGLGSPGLCHTPPSRVAGPPATPLPHRAGNQHARGTCTMPAPHEAASSRDICWVKLISTVACHRRRLKCVLANLTSQSRRIVAAPNPEPLSLRPDRTPLRICTRRPICMVECGCANRVASAAVPLFTRYQRLPAWQPTPPSPPFGPAAHQPQQPIPPDLIRCCRASPRPTTS